MAAVQHDIKQRSNALPKMAQRVVLQLPSWAEKVRPIFVALRSPGFHHILQFPLEDSDARGTYHNIRWQQIVDANKAKR